MNYECAREIMDFVLIAMRLIKTEMRGYCHDQLSVPQFRTLSYVYRKPGASLSEVAVHMGVTLPTMSRIVDKLVERGLLLRENHPASRRRLTLSLTAEGKTLLESAREHTVTQLAQRLAGLSSEQLASIKAVVADLSEALKPGVL